MIRLLKFITTAFTIITAVAFAAMIPISMPVSIIFCIALTASLVANIKVLQVPNSFDDGKKYFPSIVRLIVCARRCFIWSDTYYGANTMVKVYNTIMRNESLKELPSGMVEVGGYGFFKVRAYGPISTKEIFALRNLKEAK